MGSGAVAAAVNEACPLKSHSIHSRKQRNALKISKK